MRKKTYRPVDHARNRRWLPLIALLLLAAAALAAQWTSRAVTEQRSALAIAQFQRSHAARIQQLRQVLSQQASALDTLARLLATLPNLSDHLEQLLDELVGPKGFEYVCWADLNRGIALSAPPYATGCDQFALFNSARVSTAEHPSLFLTLPVGSRSQRNSGYLSASIDLADLLLRHQVPEQLEYILISDRDELSLRWFDISTSGLRARTAPPADKPLVRELATLIELPDIVIYYEHHLIANTDAIPLLAGASAALLLLLIGGVTTLMWWKTYILDREVAQRTEELSQFAYRASHDLKSPLTSMKQLAGLIAHDMAEGQTAAAREDVLRLQCQADNLRHLVSELFDLTNADNMLAEDQPLHFGEMLEQIKLRHGERMAQQGIKFHAVLADTLPERGPRTRLAQVLDNLIGNAIKYSDPEQDQPRVCTSIHCEGGSLHMQITDNGVGFPAEFYQRDDISLFARYRPDLATGSGVGLSIVARHVTRLGGTMSFSDQQPGTRIDMSIPGIC